MIPSPLSSLIGFEKLCKFDPLYKLFLGKIMTFLARKKSEMNLCMRGKGWK